MSEDNKSTDMASEHDRVPRSRSIGVVILLLICAAVLFAGFVALGSWQVQRLTWKRDLIVRVEQRIHAPPATVPLRQHWSDINADSDEYRHVHINGVFLTEFTTRVQASTLLGRGFWLMTPCQLTDGSVIWVNRGFIEYSAKPSPGAESGSDRILPILTAPVTVLGLVRMNEPNGTFLRPNRPDQQQWYTRDIAAMTTQYHLINVAPFFIDAETTTTSSLCSTGMCSDHPVGGLTVVSFNNNHLVYSITWYVLAFMVAVAGYVLIQTELRMWRNACNALKTSQYPKDGNA